MDVDKQRILFHYNNIIIKNEIKIDNTCVKVSWKKVVIPKIMYL